LIDRESREPSGIVAFRWTIDHDRKRVVAAAEGDVTRAELDSPDAIEREKP